MKKLVFTVGIFMLMAIFVPVAEASSTVVPGHQKKLNNDGYSDGTYVNGHYYSVYAYDMEGDWYWDLGDGRVQGTVDSVGELEQETLTVCDYVINYRADFGGDPFMDKGRIHNLINCTGEEPGNYNYLIVHETDPRYTGNPDWAVWGTWEYHVLTENGEGNFVKKMHNLEL